jgi:hypothetical protein
MAHIIQLKTFQNESGILSVFENIFDGNIKEINILVQKNKLVKTLAPFQKLKLQRGLIALNGTCVIHTKEEFFLEKPQDCLLLKSDDFFDILTYSEDCILVLIIKAPKN